MSRHIDRKAELVLADTLPGMQIEAMAQHGLVITDARALRMFLDSCGDASRCAGCNVEIWWFTARNNKRWPVTDRGINHFVDCPNAGDFKRDK